LADYARHYEEIRAAGANLVAISVDSPEKSELVRRQLRLPFAILSDANKRLIQDWDIYNPREKGGIAKPAVFIVDRNRNVLFASVDSTAARVPTQEIVRILQSTDQAAATAAPKRYFPGFGDFLRAILNLIRFRKS
jgi:peroxiredoxin